MAIKYKWVAQRLELMVETCIRKGICKLPTEAELGRKYHVSRQTVRAALALLEEKGLIVSRQGSGSYITGRLAGPRGSTVGILISSDQEYIYPGVLSDIRQALEGSGFAAQVFVTGGRVDREREILTELLKEPLPGLIVEGCKSALPSPNLDLYRSLMRTGCQTVFLYGYYPALPGSIYIKDDNYRGSALLTEYLASLGHTAIGGIFKADDLQGIERYQGFVETVRDLGLPLQDSHICWYGSQELEWLTEKKDTRFLQAMARGPLSSCTAVICYNDFLAYHLASELSRAGREPEADMALAAFDSTYLSYSHRLTAATLSHLPHEMGTRAAETLLKRLKGLPATSQEVRWTLNAREHAGAG